MKNLIGKKIVAVKYGDVNKESGALSFPGFDVTDYVLVIKFDDNSFCTISFSDDEYFHITFKEPKLDVPDTIEQWLTWTDAASTWQKHIGQSIVNVEYHHVSNYPEIPILIEFHFSNASVVTITFLEDLNLDGSLPSPFRYENPADIYIFHDQSLLNKEELLKSSSDYEIHIYHPDDVNQYNEFTDNAFFSIRVYSTKQSKEHEYIHPEKAITILAKWLERKREYEGLENFIMRNLNDSFSIGITYTAKERKWELRFEEVVKVPLFFGLLGSLKERRVHLRSAEKEEINSVFESFIKADYNILYDFFGA